MTSTSLPDPVLRTHDEFLVVRDDLVPGGTKRRVLGAVLKKVAASEFVYPSTAYGYGPLALALAGKDLGRAVRLFYAARKQQNRTPLMQQAVAAGATIVDVPLGYMNVVSARARDYCERHPSSHLLPLGFQGEEFERGLIDLVKSIPCSPREVWCAAGSGVLTRALQKAWPDAQHHAVVVARKDADTGQATQHFIAEKFQQAAKNPPPFPSALNYDAKVWDVMKQRAKSGALLWNVGA